MYKIFITGGSGYIGSYLIKFLSKNKSFALHTIRYKNKIKIKQKKNIFVYKINLTNKNKINKLLNLINPDIILNLAAFTNPKNNNENPHKSFKYNFIINKILVEYCYKYKKKIIFTSTDKVYGGNIPEPSERQDLKPNDEYGVNKLRCEKYIKKKLTKYIILRFGSVYNKFSISKKHFINQAVNNIKNKKKVYLATNIFRLFISIEKLTILISKLLKQNLYGTYNVGSNKTNYFNLVKLICKRNKIDTNNLLYKTKIKTNLNYIVPQTKKINLLIKKLIKFNVLK